MRLNNIYVVFQFHKGTIKTFVVDLYLHPLLDFNSIKVRLKQTAMLERFLMR